MKRTKILMVCLGNICRSPLAEGILKSKLDSSKFEVASAGTGGYHIGALPDPRSIAVAEHHGIDITDQRAMKFSAYHFEEFDLIYAMDTANYNDIVALAINDEEKAKVQLILNASHPNSNNSVPDPYYGGDQGFENIYQMLDQACNVIAKKLQLR